MVAPSRRLIVGSAGSANAFGTIQSVRDRWGDSVFVVAIDTNRREFVGASALADAFVRVPPARAPEFPEALRRVAAEYPDSTYLPVHDDEIEVAARLAREGALPREFNLAAPPYETVRLCNDKWEMHRWLRANGLPSPETALATPAALERMPGVAVLKAREGCAAESVPVIGRAEELADLEPDRWLVQEQLCEPEIAIDVFLSRGGDFFSCACREYHERKASVAMKVRIFNDPALAKLAERLARGVPIFGAFLLQVMQTRGGDWRVTDVNPRVGSGTRMSAAVGLDFAAANLADHWGEPVDALLRPLVGEYYVVRQYADYVTSRP